MGANFDPATYERELDEIAAAAGVEDSAERLNEGDYPYREWP